MASDYGLGGGRREGGRQRKKVRVEKRRERERDESDRTKGRGLGACVPTQQYGEFREAAQYPPDRQLIDILPHTRHVIRAVTESDTHVMHRADRYYACDFTPRCRTFSGDQCPGTSRISVASCPSSSLLSPSSPFPTSTLSSRDTRETSPDGGFSSTKREKQLRQSQVRRRRARLISRFARSSHE